MPKRYHHLWQKVTSFENLLKAYHNAQKGKRYNKNVLLFSLNLEKELLNLQRTLQDNSYRPGGYRLFTIYERKPRIIAAAPFRDRVVHHALLNIVEPLLNKRFIDDSYACRKNKGVHKAVNRYQSWIQNKRYALKMDIRQYFPSIDHLILKQKLSRCIKDKAVLNLFDLIIDSSPKYNNPPVWFQDDDLMTPFERRKGLPIGNLTSQFLANLYLNDFDHYLKEVLKTKCYLRYVDDFIVLANDKNELQQIKTNIIQFLDHERLCLHPNKVHIMPTSLGVDVLGYRIYLHKRQLRNDNGYRFARRLRLLAELYRQHRIDFEQINASVRSWIGHAQHADTKGLRQTIFADTVFRRGVHK